MLDAHHHLWDPSRVSYPWMQHPPYQVLSRPVTLEEFESNARAAGVTASVVVQAASSRLETHDLLELASRSHVIAGVVGWVDLTKAVAAQIARMRARIGGDKLVGCRHQAQDEPDANWLTQPAVTRGLQELGHAGLTFDLLVTMRELPAALCVAQAAPGTQFILDHLGKPPLAEPNDFRRWESFMSELAALPNVTAKLSGLLTEAPGFDIDHDGLRAAVDTALEAFGPSRLMIGSDWPVSTLAVTYTKSFEWLKAMTAGLGPAERQLLYMGTAVNVYGLDSSIGTVYG